MNDTVAKNHSRATSYGDSAEIGQRLLATQNQVLLTMPR
jgi:hypothetical protein